MEQETRSYDMGADELFEKTLAALKRIRRVRRYTIDPTSRTVRVRLGAAASDWGKYLPRRYAAMRRRAA